MDNYSRQFSDAELSRIEKRLKKEYTQASKEMQQKRDSIMKSYAKERDKRLSSLDGSDEAKKAFEDWCKDQAMRQKWVNDMAEELARQAVEVDKSAMGIVRDSVAEVFAEGANFAAYDIERQSLVNTNFTLLNRNAVMELAKDDPKLLPAPKVNVPKDIAWNKRHFSSAITQGILQGESVNDIGKRLTQVLDMDMRAAMRNARTAVNSAENLGTMHSFELAEEMGINLKKKWLSTMDDRTRDSHIILDGEEVDNDEPFSNGLMFPSDPNGEPAEVYNCRCVMVAAVDGHDMSDAERNSKLGDMSYEEWKEEAQNRLNEENIDSSGTPEIPTMEQSNTISMDNFINFFPMDEGGYREIDISTSDYSQFRSEGLNGTLYQKWLEESDGYGTPRVVSSAQIDDMISDGAKPIYRGMPTTEHSTGEDKLKQFMYGDKYYAGEGIYGDGIYFAENEGTAHMYKTIRDKSTGEGSVLRAVVDPNATSIEVEELKEMYYDYLDSKSGLYLMDDQGGMSAFARSKGYQTIYVYMEDYYVVLDRSAIVMDEVLL